MAKNKAVSKSKKIRVKFRFKEKNDGDNLGIIVYSKLLVEYLRLLKFTNDNKENIPHYFFKLTKDEELNTSSTAKQGVVVKSLDIVGTASVLGRTLRHGRLMADLMTRKERNVEELNAAPQGFY